MERYGPPRRFQTLLANGHATVCMVIPVRIRICVCMHWKIRLILPLQLLNRIRVFQIPQLSPPIYAGKSFRRRNALEIRRRVPTEKHLGAVVGVRNPARLSPALFPLLQDGEEEAAALATGGGGGGEVEIVVDRDFPVAVRRRTGLLPIAAAEKQRDLLRISSDILSDERSELFESQRGVEGDISSIGFALSIEEKHGNRG